MKKILLAVSLLTSLTLRSQTDNILINRNYDNRYFIDLIKDMEKSTTINFFYDSNDIDSIKVVQSEVPASLNRILDSTLNNNYSYIINNNNVIITQDYKIDTSLPYYFTVDAFLNEKAKKEIAKLEALKFCKTMAEGKDENDSCAKCLVCQFQFEEEETIRVLPCRHYFHDECVDQWLMAKDCCPYCRQCIVIEEN